MDNTSNLLAGILATSDNVDSVDSLDSVGVDYTAKKNKGSFVASNLDNEFDIPDVDHDNLPSLESILNENDNDVFQVDTIATEPLNESRGSFGSTASLVPDCVSTNKTLINGAILRHVALKKISGQMLDACARRDAGLPTAIAASSLVAIGTSHGVVLVFEPRDQTLKLILGTISDGAKYGAVTALGINVECTRLLSGYAKGQIQMWDLHNGSCLRTIADAHPIGYAVLHLQFTDDPTIAMCNDSSGSVYSLSFKRVITRTCESTCFFSGSRGEVCTMAPLHLHPGMKDHPLYDCSLLAMASLTKLILVNLKPSPVAVFVKRLPGKSDSLPVLSWQFAVVQLEEQGKQFCPVLAFARETKIHFIQVFKHNKEFEFTPFQFIEVDYTLIALHWLSPKIIAVIDKLEKIHVIDVKSKMELECLDLGVVRLVYGSSYFKSLSTGGNVSKALKAAGEFACYQSVQVFNGQLLLLGTKSINCLTLRNWLDRLDYFVKQSLFIEALELALSFYNDTAMAVVGLSAHKRKRKELVAEQIIDIVSTYTDVMMTANAPKTNDRETLIQYYKTVVPVCVKYCLAINNLDLLYTEIYDRFNGDLISKISFLECLQPFILKGELKYLSAVVMQDFVEHYEKSNKLKEMESCLVMLDASAVDLHHMIKLCWIHELYDAVIYVYNRGLMDYITPLEQLLRILNSHMEDKKKSSTTEAGTLGLKLFVYISCCLAGRQYPIGEIDPSLVKDVKNNVFECLISRIGKYTVGGEQSYPYLRTLLLYDTREFLNVLSLAFEENEFGLDEHSIALGMRSRRQSVVDLLIQIMVNDSSFSPSHVGSLFTFIARQMAKFENSIKVNKLLFEQVLEYLSNPDDDSRHEERQQALLDLLFAGGLGQFDDTRLLTLAESAKFYRVCEYLYQKKKLFEKVLSCYYRDPARKMQVFSYVDEVLHQDSFTDLDREEICKAVLNSINELVLVDARKLSRLILQHFPGSFHEVADKLQSNPEVQFLFLRGVFNRRHRKRSRESGKRDEADISPETNERYIELMCTFDPEAVHSYLQETTDYRLEPTLCIVREKKIIDATAFLLEKTGNITEAFDLLVNHLETKVRALDEAYAGFDNLDVEESRGLREDLITSLNYVINFCQRCSPHLEKEDRNAIWFPLLETVMSPQRRIKDMTCEHFLTFKEFTKLVLTSMMGHIALPDVLQTIMNNPAYSSGKFGEMKELLLGMLDTYTYELTLLETTNNLLGNDLFHQYKTQYKILSKGIATRHFYCQACNQNLKSLIGNKDDSLLVFKCSHIYHKSCLESVLGYGEEATCIVCNSSGMTHTSSSPSSSTKSASKATKPIKEATDKSSNLGVALLTSQQEAALDNLYASQKSTTSVESFQNLHETKRNDNVNFSGLRGTSSYRNSFSTGEKKNRFANEGFDLRLAPPLQ